jgi:hypothetical protein
MAPASKENAMNRNAISLAPALCAALLASGSAWAQMNAHSARIGYPNYPYDNAYNPGTFGYYGSPNNYGYSYSYGYPYDYTAYPYGYANPLGLAAAIAAPIAAMAAAPVEAAAATVPLVTGRSVATGQMGNSCTTPAKTCELYHASFVGNGCSCRVPGGRERGSVTP